jgi:hypothetical protein
MITFDMQPYLRRILAVASLPGDTRPLDRVPI